jgi:DNA-binding MarR family transcriptional regulator
MPDCVELHDDDTLLHHLRKMVLVMLKEEGRDLDCRDLAVLLISIDLAQPDPQYRLAEQLNIARPIVSRIVDKLELLELVARFPNPNDRRSVLVIPSAKGRALGRRLARG